MARRKQSGIDINARFSVRDFILIISMVLGSGNFFWCLHHDKQIEELRKEQTEQNQKEKKKDASQQFTAFHSGR